MKEQKKILEKCYELCNECEGVTLEETATGLMVHCGKERVKHFATPEDFLEDEMNGAAIQYYDQIAFQGPFASCSCVGCAVTSAITRPSMPMARFCATRHTLDERRCKSSAFIVILKVYEQQNFLTRYVMAECPPKDMPQDEERNQRHTRQGTQKRTPCPQSSCLNACRKSFSGYKRGDERKHFANFALIIQQTRDFAIQKPNR